MSKFKFGGIYDGVVELEEQRSRVFLEKMPKRDTDSISYMTAIACFPLGDSFVIGTDGLRQTTDYEVETETGQKLFHFRGKHISLAYAWCGHTVNWSESVDDHRERTVLFDFQVATKGIFPLADYAMGDFSKFAGALQGVLYTALVWSNANCNWMENISERSIARMLAVGFCERGHSPVQFEVTISYLGTPIVQIRQISLDEFPVNRLYVFCGPQNDRQAGSVSEAAKQLEEYIPWAANVKKGKIGKEPQIALITRDTFGWLKSP